MTQQEPMEQPEPQSSEPAVGKKLQAERIAKGEELESVANRLRLDVKTLQALEEGDHQQLPEPIFVRGYIQGYAKLMGMDVAPLLECYNQSAPSEPELKGAGPTTSFGDSGLRGESRTSILQLLKPLLGLLIVAVVAALLWYLWPFSSDSELVVAQDSSQQGSLALPIVTSSPSVENEPEPIFEQNAEPEVDVSTPKPVVNTPPSVPSAEAEVVPEVMDRLHLSTEQESWITIHDSRDERVMYDLLKPNTTREVEGVAPFRVLLGYAAGVTLTINGEAFDVTPYIRKNSARFTLERP